MLRPPTVVSKRFMVVVHVLEGKRTTCMVSTEGHMLVSVEDPHAKNMEKRGLLPMIVGRICVCATLITRWVTFILIVHFSQQVQ